MVIIWSKSLIQTGYQEAAYKKLKTWAKKVKNVLEIIENELSDSGGSQS